MAITSLVTENWYLLLNWFLLLKLMVVQYLDLETGARTFVKFC